MTVIIWDVTTGKSIQTFRGHSDVVRSIAYSPNGNSIASGSEDATVKLWDVNTGNCTKTFYHDFEIYCITYSSNGNQVASTGQENVVRIWDIDTGICTNTLNGHIDTIFRFAYSPN